MSSNQLLPQSYPDTSQEGNGDLQNTAPPCEVIFRLGKKENDSFKRFIPVAYHYLFVPDRFPNISKVYVNANAFKTVINTAPAAQNADSAPKGATSFQTTKGSPSTFIDAFPVGAVYETRARLVKDLNTLAIKHNFITLLRNQTNIKCCVKGCTFQINASALCKVPKKDKPSTSQDLMGDERPCYISSINPEHSDHEFTKEEVRKMLTKSGYMVQTISDPTIAILSEILVKNPNMKVNDMRSLIKPFVPACVDLNSKRIIYLKKKILMQDRRVEDHAANIQMIQTLLSETKFEYLDAEEMEDHCDYSTVHATDIMNLFIQEYSSLEESCFDFVAGNTLESYCALLKKAGNDFDYRTWKDTDGTLLGLVWMTGAMRDAFERYGTLISIDFCLKGYNIAFYPYAAIVGMEETDENCNKLRVFCEGIMIGELSKSVAFLSNSMFEMAHQRKKEDVRVVIGDGFLSQELVTNVLQLPFAVFLTCLWHLLVRNLPDNIGLTRFKKIKNLLWKMADAPSEYEFLEKYKEILKRMNELNAPSNEMDYLATFMSRSREYALYHSDSIPGSFRKRSSQLSEVQHSTLRAYLGRDYCQPPYRLLCDLLSMGVRRQSELSEDLHKSKTFLRTWKTVMEHKHLPDALQQASSMVLGKGLKYSGVLRYAEEWNMVWGLSKELQADGSTIITDGNESYMFSNVLSKCPGCTSSTAFLIQCKHAIKNKLGAVPDNEIFDINDFDRRWHYQHDICLLDRNDDNSSETIGGIGGSSTACPKNNQVANMVTTEQIRAHVESGRRSSINHGDLIPHPPPQKRGRPSYNDHTYSLAVLGFRDVEQITKSVTATMSSCGDKNLQKMALGLMVELNEILKRGQPTSARDLQSAYDNFAGCEMIQNHTSTITKDPRAVQVPYAVTQIRHNPKHTSQLRGTRQTAVGNCSHGSHTAGMNMKNSERKPSCGFCAMVGHTIVKCPLKDDYGKEVLPHHLSQFKNRLLHEYPIGSTVAQPRYSDSDSFVTHSCYHFVVHSIHPRNSTIPDPCQPIDLVIQVTALQKKNRNANGSDGPGKAIHNMPVFITGEGLFKILDRISGKSLIFDKVDTDGTGVGFDSRFRAAASLPIDLNRSSHAIAQHPSQFGYHEDDISQYVNHYSLTGRPPVAGHDNNDHGQYLYRSQTHPTHAYSSGHDNTDHGQYPYRNQTHPQHDYFP
jgi:hypothetical protein